MITAKYKALISSLEDVQNENTVTNAKTIVRSSILMERINFIVSLFAALHILSFTKPLTLALQSLKCNISKTYSDAQTCIRVVEDQGIDEMFRSKVWVKVTAIGNSR